MKKIYSLTIGLLVGLASAHAQVVNVTTGVEYDADLLTACNNANDGDVIQVSQSVSVNNRLLYGKSITVEGVGEGITITNTGGTMIAGIDAANKTMTFKNLTFTASRSLGTHFQVSAKAGAALVMEDVVIKDLTGTSANGLFEIKSANNISLTLHNVKIENCKTAAPYDLKVWRNLQLNLSGNNDLTIGVNYEEDKGQTKINVDGELTNTEAISIDYAGEIGKTLVTNCTDASKFELTDPDLRLEVDGNNLVVKSSPVMVESSDSSADGSYESLQDAINAISASTATEATIALGSNQTVTSRITLQDGKIYTIVPAEGKDVSIAVGSKDIAFLVQKSSVLNISNINICGTGQSVARNQFEAKERGTINFNNVIVSGLDLPNYTVVRALSGGYFNATDVKAENCTGLTAFAFYGLSGSKLIGESNIDLMIENNNSVNAAEWTPSEPIFVEFTFTGAGRPNNSDVLLNYTDLSMVNIVNTDWALYSDGKNIRARNDKAPAPVASVEGNVISLSCEEGFSVWYAVTASNEAPEAGAYQPYENGIDVESFGNEVNYVWAIAKGEGYVASDPVFVGVFNNGGSEEGVIYSQVESAEQLGEGFSCIIVVENSNGEYRALGENMKGVDVKINNGVISAFKSDFKATEFQHNGGVLTENGAAASRAAALSLDGLKVMAGSEQLGYDEASDSFSTDGANKNLMLFTTGSNKNTGVDEVAVDNESAPVEYYNLQGVRVENPANGLYIKRQGSKVEKVIIR